ncbi:MAG: alpha-rhamnosidase [Saprospiraceae bacterium]|nr:MAG: alpha-rhamnosidase [Saprospiraceae bacterium]
MGIDMPSPRLSWELEGSKRNLKQSAYQILVASSADLLDADKGDLWDSQKVLSDETAHIRYAGNQLKSAVQVFWKIRAWDQEGKVSAWSKAATWTMGLMTEEEWKGKWIGLEGKVDPAYLRGTNWIVFPGDRSSPPTEPVERFYRRIVDIPANKEVKRAELLYTGDYSCNGGLNGAKFGTRNNHNRIKNPSIAFRLVEGENVVTLTGTTPGKTVPSGGVVALIKITFMDGDQIIIPTDEQWKVSDVEVDGWDKPGFDDSAWQSALNLGPVGPKPLGEVLIAENRRLPASYLRKEFEAAPNIKRATVFYSGLGWSELYLNGKKIGDEVLSPGLSEYPKRIFYVTADVTNQLRRGNNAIGVLLGNGRFFAPRSETYASMPTLGFPKLRLHLRIEYDDNTIKEIVSDESWKLTDNGPIIANNDYDGEEYDARKELGNWTSIGYNDAAWQQAEAAIVPEGKLQAQMIEPIRVTERLKPIAITEPEPGRFIFDLGQNIVGWCRLKVSGSAGTTVTLRHAETLLPDGKLSLVNMRAAEVTDVYTLKGNGIEIWEPRFTTHGFRYVEVRGYPGQPDLQTIEGVVVNDDLRITGTFYSSNTLLNHIYKNATWGVRGNYKSIPMDCPQRDERQGWLGDRTEVMRGEAYMFDVAAFYPKWLQDIRDVQQDNGSIPNIAPNYWSGKGDNVVWPSASITITNALYEQYADKEVIANNYESSKRWMALMSTYIKNGITECDKYGDWCVPPEDLELIHTNDPSRITGKAVLATTFLYHDAKLMEKFATLLGYQEDANQYATLAATLKKAFNRDYYNAELGQYDNGTQTSYVLPLAFGMVPEDQRTRVFNNLVKNIVEKSNSHVSTGLVGGQYLYRVLSDNGRPDLAYTIATQPDYPGFGYMISQGATTIWELWNGNTADPSMNSGNHVMLIGDFVIWLYADLAGIKPDASQPGFKHIIMKPHIIGDLTHVKASYHSLRGEILSDWHTDTNQFEWNITIPPNTSATVYLPTTDAALITENGKPLAQVKDVKYKGKEENYTVYSINSGAYQFKIEK